MREIWYDYLVRKLWSYARKNGGVYIVWFFIFKWIYVNLWKAKEGVLFHKIELHGDIELNEVMLKNVYLWLNTNKRMLCFISIVFNKYSWSWVKSSVSYYLVRTIVVLWIIITWRWVYPKWGKWVSKKVVGILIFPFCSHLSLRKNP